MTELLELSCNGKEEEEEEEMKIIRNVVNVPVCAERFMQAVCLSVFPELREVPLHLMMLPLPLLHLKDLHSCSLWMLLGSYLEGVEQFFIGNIVLLSISVLTSNTSCFVLVIG